MAISFRPPQAEEDRVTKDWRRVVSNALSKLFNNSTDRQITPASADLIPVFDASDDNNLKKATAQSIAELATGGLTLASGLYAPTGTIVSNASTITLYEGQYSRVGNVVTQSGKIDIDASVANTRTQVRITLAIDSDLSEGSQGVLAGTCSGQRLDHQGAVAPDTTNDEAVLDFYPASAANTGVFYQFTYYIY